MPVKDVPSTPYLQDENNDDTFPFIEDTVKIIGGKYAKEMGVIKYWTEDIEPSVIWIERLKQFVIENWDNIELVFRPKEDNSIIQQNDTIHSNDTIKENKQEWAQIGDRVKIISGVYIYETGEVKSINKESDSVTVWVKNQAIDKKENEIALLTPSNNNHKPDDKNKKQDVKNETTDHIDANGDKLFVGAKVKQVQGNSRAFGIGDITQFRPDNNVVVEFFSSRKVLPCDHFALYKSGA